MKVGKKAVNTLGDKITKNLAQFVRFFRPSPTLVQLAHLQISLFTVHRLSFVSQAHCADLHAGWLAVVVEGGGEAAVGIELGIGVPV